MPRFARSPGCAATRRAAKIAGVDRQWLNESISRGYYNCAPSDLVKGSREFDRDDLVALYIFGVLAKEGLSLARAGYMACECLSALRNEGYSPVESLHAVYSGEVLVHVFPNKLFKPELPSAGGLLIDRVREFKINVIRSKLEERIRRETEVFGEA